MDSLRGIDAFMNSNAEASVSRPQIFTVLAWYLPGYKAGGPIRSIANLVAVLGREFCFRIVTSDRDLGDTSAYPGVETDRWVPVGEANVMYLAPGWRGHLKMMALLRSVDHGTVLYLNGFFGRRYAMLAIFMNWLGLLQTRHLVVAPRGEFSSGALGIKPIRKLVYIAIASRLGLYRQLIWHASTELEAADIRRYFPEASDISILDIMQNIEQQDGRAEQSVLSIAKDIGLISGPANERTRQKRPGQLSVVFVSRISPMKNLLTAVTLLQGVSGDVSFDIYGPAEDMGYWNQCKKAIESLPANIRVEYRGTVEHARVHDVFAEHDLFLFPTLGESYGHVICEALIAGCPVLLSDQTQWRNLEEAGVGWDIPLGENGRFQTAVQQCIDADEEWYAGFVARTREYAEKLIDDPAVVEANRKMFRYASGRENL
jgi:glycosyltransferase involved in cell wall biosynthesis